MRKVIGGLVFCAGLGGLTYWGAQNHAVQMQEAIAGAADKVVQGTLHEAEARVLARDIYITGLMDSEEERNAILASLDGIDGRRVIVDQTETIPFADPYRFAVDENGTVSGHIPSEAMRVAMAEQLGADVSDLVLTSGAPDENWAQAVTTSWAARESLKTGVVSLEGRTVAVSGLAATPVEANQVMALLNTLPAGYSAQTNIDVEDDGKPFLLNANFDGKDTTYSGKVPHGADATLDISAEAVVVARIPDATGTFIENARLGLEGLKALQSGELHVTKDEIRLSGLALTPDHGASISQGLAAAKETQITTNFDFVDDGTPAKFDLGFDANTGAHIVGKLPLDGPREKMADLLGFEVSADQTKQSLVAKGAADFAALEILQSWLPEFETADVSFENGVRSIKGNLSQGVDAELVLAGLQKAFPEADISLEASATTPPDGATRVHFASGQKQFAQGGFWLPERSFTPTLMGCRSETSAILKSMTINYVIGSARLNARSVRAVNAMAAMLLRCFERVPKYVVEIGGHTDAQGGDEANLTLSQARADTVRTALIARGVDGARLRSVGYGETQPIADNETEEGRAANRRTTVRWSYEN